MGFLGAGAHRADRRILEAGRDDPVEQGFLQVEMPRARDLDDPAAQEELWKQANIQILTDIVAIPLQYQNQVYARNPNVDYGHELVRVLALYPGIDETTTITQS